MDVLPKYFDPFQESESSGDPSPNKLDSIKSSLKMKSANLKEGLLSYFLERTAKDVVQWPSSPEAGKFDPVVPTIWSPALSD